MKKGKERRGGDEKTTENEVNKCQPWLQDLLSVWPGAMWGLAAHPRAVKNQQVTFDSTDSPSHQQIEQQIQISIFNPQLWNTVGNLLLDLWKCYFLSEWPTLFIGGKICICKWTFAVDNTGPQPVLFKGQLYSCLPQSPQPAVSSNIQRTQ